MQCRGQRLCKTRRARTNASATGSPFPKQTRPVYAPSSRRGEILNPASIRRSSLAEMLQSATSTTARQHSPEKAYRAIVGSPGGDRRGTWGKTRHGARTVGRGSGRCREGAGVRSAAVTYSLTPLRQSSAARANASRELSRTRYVGRFDPGFDTSTALRVPSSIRCKICLVLTHRRRAAIAVVSLFGFALGSTVIARNVIARC